MNCDLEESAKLNPSSLTCFPSWMFYYSNRKEARTACLPTTEDDFSLSIPAFLPSKVGGRISGLFACVLPWRLVFLCQCLFQSFACFHKELPDPADFTSCYSKYILMMINFTKWQERYMSPEGLRSPRGRASDSGVKSMDCFSRGLMCLSQRLLGGLQPSVIQFQGIWHLLLVSAGTGHARNAYTYMWELTHTHKASLEKRLRMLERH